MKLASSIVSGIGALGIASAPAYADAQSNAPLAGVQLAQASLPVVAGEVRKVDRAASKLTIKHGPIPNLDMQGMTMTFGLKDPAMMGKLKEGDKLRFSVDYVGGQYTIMRIEPAK